MKYYLLYISTTATFIAAILGIMSVYKTAVILALFSIGLYVISLGFNRDNN